MPIITNIEDLRILHKKRTPKMFYDTVIRGLVLSQPIGLTRQIIKK